MVSKPDVKDLKSLTKQFEVVNNPNMINDIIMIVKFIATWLATFIIYKLIIWLSYNVLDILIIASSELKIQIILLIIAAVKIMCFDLNKYMTKRNIIKSLPEKLSTIKKQRSNLNKINQTIRIDSSGEDFREPTRLDILNYYVNDTTATMNLISAVDMSNRVKGIMVEDITKLLMKYERYAESITTESAELLNNLLKIVTDNATVTIRVEINHYAKSFDYTEEEINNLIDNINKKVAEKEQKKSYKEQSFNNSYWKRWDSFFKTFGDFNFENGSTSNSKRTTYREQSSTEKQVNTTDKKLSEALKLFNLNQPFTEAELKKKRNELLKKYHPDQTKSEDTTEMSSKINTMYTYLLDYTSVE
jgi:hypothetical protein